MQLLVVDDDAQLVALLREFLSPLGFNIEHFANGDSLEARLAVAPLPDVLLLDVMLPGRDGFALCAAARAICQVPILMLSARGDDADRIHGLELGADDYLAKPFNPRELALRLKALARRGVVTAASTLDAVDTDVIRFGAVSVHLGAMQVQRGARSVTLTTHEFQLLAALARALGSPISREQLAAAVSSEPYDPTVDRSIDVHIAHLRQKLEDDPKQPAYLRTVRGVGYMLAAVPVVADLATSPVA